MKGTKESRQPFLDSIRRHSNAANDPDAPRRVQQSLRSTRPRTHPTLLNDEENAYVDEEVGTDAAPFIRQTSEDFGLM